MNEYFTISPMWEEVRFNHDDCGDRKLRLYVKRTPKGWTYHCHNCGWSGRRRYMHLSPEEVSRLAAARQEHTQEPVYDTVQLPPDAGENIPEFAYAWLKKYSLTDKEICELGCKWSESLQRLILPVYNNGQLVYWQGRGFTPGKPKYINPRVKRGSVLVKNLNHADSKLILVEDIISAKIVARLCNSAALLGSYLGTDATKQISALKPSRVGVWLDPDKHREAHGIAMKLALSAHVGVVRPIFSSRDPKEHSNGEIKKILVGSGFLEW